jgi:tetratricopeptide (TPR) repeat protein
MTDAQKPGSRLERALEVFLAAPPTSRGEADRLLQQHPDLHEVLAPMLDVPGHGAEGADHTTERVLGDFRLVREVGRGAMGVVYEAWQRSLDRRVAVKVLAQGLLASPASAARFRREAGAAARLRHPNIVEVYGFGDADGEHFYAMQFVDGASLHECMAAWRTPERAVRLAAAVAEALAHAHAQGLVHRDVKPANVLVGNDGAVLLTDFGVARDEALPTLTRDGGFVGTLDYAAPEQVRGERVDARADVWALGVILFELLHGTRPFTAITQEATMRNILVAEPPSLRGQAGITTDLAAVVDRALQKDPLRRYASAAAMAADLRAVQNGEPVSARLPSSFERMLRWARREPWRALAAGVVLVALPVSTGSIGYLWANQPRIRAAAAEEVLRARDESLARAWFERLDGRGERALQALARLPADDAEVAFLRSRLLLDLGRRDAARAALQPLTHPAIDLARRALDRDTPPFDDLLSAGSDPFDCLVRAALVFESKPVGQRTPKRRAAAAIALVEQAMLVSSRPRASDAVQLAFFALQAKDQAAMARADRVLTAHFAANPTVRRLRALLLAETDAKAALEWIAAMPADPEQTAYVASARGRAHERLGDLGAAVAAYREALAADGNRASDWANLGTTLRKQKQFDEATTALRRAVELRPHDPFFGNLLALTLRDAGQTAAAAALFVQVAATAPDYAPASYNLGNLLFREGDLDGAIQAFRRAVAIEPADVRHVANLGDALSRAGQHEEALAWSLRAAELAPGDLVPQYNVAQLALKLGLRKLALQAALRAQENAPDQARGLEIVAEALLAQDTVDAEAALAAARAADQHQQGKALDARLLVARALFAAGQRTEAIHELEAAQALPAFAADEAQAKIAALLSQWRAGR